MLHSAIRFLKLCEPDDKPRGFGPATLCLESIRSTLQVLPEWWLYERNQQIVANPSNLFSSSLVVICRIFGAASHNLRHIFETIGHQKRRRQKPPSGAN